MKALYNQGGTIEEIIGLQGSLRVIKSRNLLLSTYYALAIRVIS